MLKKKLLLHACCGPCSTSAIERLLDEGWQIVLYFPNSNIYPEAEADLRYKELLRVAERYDLEVIREIYDHHSWLEAIATLEDEPEGGKRCEACFAYNFGQAAAKAKELGINHFATTLTVSRFKKSDQIFKVGEAFVGFTPIDFKKKGGFDASVRLAKAYGLYRQSYCGCEFSMRT